ncbi:MAG: hypothetical protein PVH29_14995 [Candidatus Zixiibacteriota bacterium]
MRRIDGWRGRVFSILILAAAVTAAAAAAEEGPWRYLLTRTLIDEQGRLNMTLYMGDLVSRSYEAVYEFEPGFDVRAVIPNPTWDYALITGAIEEKDGDVVRFCKVPLRPGLEYEVVFEDRYRRHDDPFIIPAPESEVFYLCRHFSVVSEEGADPQLWTIFYRYAPESGVEELAELDRDLAFHGIAGENALYVNYDEWLPEGRTTIYGFYDLVTGELKPSGFEPPRRDWYPVDPPLGPPVPGEGPLNYALGVEDCGSSCGVVYYIRKPGDTGDYRKVVIENTTAEYVYCYGRDAIVYIPELDVEENGVRIVTKYLDGTYGEPFPLPTEPTGSEPYRLRHGYELFYVEGEAPRGLVGLGGAPPQ